MSPAIIAILVLGWQSPATPPPSRGFPEVVEVEVGAKVGPSTPANDKADASEPAQIPAPEAPPDKTSPQPAKGTADTTPQLAEGAAEPTPPSSSSDTWVADGEGFDFDFDALSGDTSEDSDEQQQTPGGDTPLDAPAPVAETSTAKKPKVRAGDILSGALRLTGAFLHFPDEPLLFANGDDGMVLGEGRFIINTPAGKHLKFDINTFVDVSRLPTGGTLNGAFTSASSGSAYRTRFLSWNYWQNGGVRGNLGVDRLAMTILAGPATIDIGRFPINYTVTGAFTPNDVYAPFSPTTVNRIFKPGVDALRFSFAVGNLASIDVLGTLGYASNDAPTWGQSSVFARAGFVGGGFEWAVLGGKLAQRWIVGGSAQGDAGPIGLRTEFHVGFPDREGDGRKANDNELPIYTRIAGGPNVAFGWHNTSLSAEYMFVSDGRSNAADYLDRAMSLAPDDIPYLGKHYVSASFGLDIIPILRLQTLALVNASDGSGLGGLTLAYNAADEVDLIVGSFIPWGKKLQNVDPMAGSFELGSEYGLAALTIYLETRVFF